MCIFRTKNIVFLPVNISQHFVPPDRVESKVGWSEHGEGTPSLEAGGEVCELQGLDQHRELGQGAEQGEHVSVAPPSRASTFSNIKSFR